ncbi:MAG: 3-hydroxyacyl-ACP dehydratase FabZ [Clostridiales bacterium]|nr:3-hydroxyacyl-ACP dehydratase FabZ [Clostridiales bacterium]
MNQQEIKEFMPHRPPMLLLDEAHLLDAGQARGAYRVQEDEIFLQGHFPGNPIMPGVMLCEMIAQTAGILVKDELQKGRTPLFVGIERVRFRRMVKPGETVQTACRLLRAAGSLIRIAGEARVGDELCCQGEFLLMLTPQEG